MRLSLDQFDFIAVRILDEGNNRGAEFHRPRLAGDFCACRAQRSQVA